MLPAKVVILGALIGVAFDPSAEGARPPCPLDEAVAWARAHRGSLPTTRADIIQLSRVRQRAVMMTLPVSVRVRLWREHFAVIKHSLPDLSPAELQLIEDVSASLPSILRIAPAEWSKDPRVAAHQARARMVMSRERAYRTFVDPFEGQSSESRSIATDIRSRGPARASEPSMPTSATCNCNSWGCGGNQECKFLVAGWECESTSFGCGWLLQEECNGLCGYVEQVSAGAEIRLGR
jgi:hypothetical protein